MTNKERALEELGKAMVDPGDTDWIHDLPEYVPLPTTAGDVVAIMRQPHGVVDTKPSE